MLTRGLEWIRGDRQALATVVVGMALGLTLGWSVSIGSLAAAGVIAAAIVVFLALAFPEVGVFMLLAYMFGLDRLRLLEVLPYEVRWLWDLVVLALLLRVLADAARGKAVWFPRAAMPWGVLLVVVCVTSVLTNQESPVLALVGLRQYLLPLALTFAMLNLCPRTMSLRRIFIALVLAAIVQVPVSALQFLSAGSVSDLNTGTLGLHSGPDMLMLVLFAVAVLVYLVAVGKLRPAVSLVVPFLCLPPLFAGVRAAVVLTPLVVLLSVYVAVRERRRISMAIGMIVVTGCLAVAALMLVPGVSDRVLGANTVTWGEAVVRETAQGSAGTGRITAVREAASIAGQDLTSGLVGLGPGAATPSRVGGAASIAFGFDVQRSQVSVTLVELGWGGLVAIVGTLVALLAAAARRSDDALDSWVRGAARSLLPWGALYVIMFAYSAVWRAYVPSLLLAVVLAARLSNGARDATARSRRED